MKEYQSVWTYKGKDVTSESLIGFFGFVYIITDNETGKKYIGRKYIWNMRKKDGSTRRKKVESNWKEYFSSNLELSSIGKVNPNRLKREIMHLCKGKGETNWREVEEIVKHNAIYDDNFLNDNLSGKYFRKNVKRYYE